MPIEKRPGGKGYMVHNTNPPKKPMTKTQAEKQLAAIEISKHARRKGK